jgi:hypothetical protein
VSCQSKPFPIEGDISDDAAKVRALMQRRAILLVTMLTALAGASGCKPEIGDECSVSTDCSSTGDRLCDTTQPNGYCTIYNCEPGTCPEEAICVSFEISKSEVCEDPQLTSPFQRSFCMRNCSSDDDCRGGYDCVDMNDPLNEWGAAVNEYGPVNGAICISPYAAAALPDDYSTAVCHGNKDAGYDGPIITPDAGTPLTDGGVEDADTDADAATTDPDASLDASGDADADLDAGTDAATDT